MFAELSGLQLRLAQLPNAAQVCCVLDVTAKGLCDMYLVCPQGWLLVPRIVCVPVCLALDL